MQRRINSQLFEDVDDDHHVQSLDAKMQSLQTQLDEAQKLLFLKVQRLDSKHQHLEDKLDQVAQELRQRNLHLTSKVTERTFASQKMEGMVERHHQIVRGFEMKLSSLQKLIDEQEMQMRSQMSIIQDLRHELRRK